jgi:NOL1/NOP2/sun family putative RNA methylase
MQSLLGEEFPTFRESYSNPALAGLRVNTLKITSYKYTELSPYGLTSLPWCPSGFIHSSGVQHIQPGKHPHHAAGLYYLQEPSAMAVAEILAPRPGERVLDISAAPGGKTTHLAAFMHNQGLLVANEIHPKRVWDLAENIERSGVRIATITNETPDHLAEHFGSYFDRVLLDAPCSGEGMFRKSAAARSAWSPEHVQSCALRQYEILSTAARLVRAGGSLVYSTCTFAPEENEQVIGHFLSGHPEYRLIPIPDENGFSPGNPGWAAAYDRCPLELTARLWPHRTPGEGHFIAHLQRTGSSAPFVSPSRPVSLPPNLARQFQQFLAHTLTGIDFNSNFHLVGSYLYQLPDHLLEPVGLKFIHPGWWLGVFKKDRFEPSHALALGLTASQALRTHSISSGDPTVIHYLKGESLASPGEDGWTLVTVDGFPLGWGKRVQRILKNSYPHGLRWR